ncbi:hypothetical protein RISK_000170 [Rhodopirellula islandica]|uniref:Uncharacterized protein n=1 Tax=Rhodopirellula islandica TaxID=595434 RepID=A0A0J1BMS5_RHOIS|nr:hypothetical protein RISK_000170 [Rhodopirellula islandica]
MNWAIDSIIRFALIGPEGSSMHSASKQANVIAIVDNEQMATYHIQNQASWSLEVGNAMKSESPVNAVRRWLAPSHRVQSRSWDWMRKIA